MTELPKAYDPAEVDPDLYEDWLAAGLFHADPDDPGEPFAIVFPPPNVTGSLHIGHALTFAIEDAMIRHARMQGKNAVFMPGMDHAGIATQNVVEKQLAAEGLTRHDLGREAFIERVWEWKAEYGGRILDQLRRLGTSADWDREIFTFDEARSRAVREVFVTLHEQGLMYRGNRLINWCPRCQTALSEIEVDHEDVRGELARFRYPLVGAQDGDGGVQAIEVATTRAETMLGDTAIAVHPDDERYTHLVGREVRHPFQDRTFRIVADDYVDPEFGSGAVKITPAHDPNDHAIALRHDLEIIDIMTDQATLTEVVGERFAGLDRFEARRQVKEELDALGLLVAVDEHEHPVGHCSRCKTVVEPRLSDQWFLEVRPLADKAAAAVRDGRTTLLPERFTTSFLDWLDGLYDWCVSRQIWWGHRIPAWYCGEGHITVSRDDHPPACAECGDEELVQDEDVLDTWFSSQLWPFTVFGWEKPGDTTPELETWYPTAVLETGYDINTFWVSRMLMIGLWFLDEVPFHTIYNHGMVRDQYGKKMSKSFGNVIDPLEFIDAYGADALRFALFQHTSPGTDVPLAPEWVEGAKRFTNKLWNATRFALGTLDGTRPGDLPPAADLALEDRWILSALERTRAQVEAAYATWDYARVSQALFHFTWDELADWYLEAVKIRVYGDDEAAKAVAQQVLARVLDDVLRLLHPLTPFVTEALWRALTGAAGGTASLMVQPEPDARPDAIDADAESAFDAIRDLVTQVRRFRSGNGIAPSKRFDLTVTSAHRDVLEPNAGLAASLAGLSDITFVDELGEVPGTSTIVLADGQCQVELSGLIDVAAEVARIDRELDKARGDLRGVEGKLSNANFVDKAPAEVVQASRDKAAALTATIAELDAQRAQLADVAS